MFLEHTALWHQEEDKHLAAIPLHVLEARGMDALYRLLAKQKGWA